MGWSLITLKNGPRRLPVSTTNVEALFSQFRSATRAVWGVVGTGAHGADNASKRGLTEEHSDKVVFFFKVRKAFEWMSKHAMGRAAAIEQCNILQLLVDMRRAQGTSLLEDSWEAVLAGVTHN